ncbi:hypothetical protein [Laspinema olomoucense]|uniref:hypothetical protein n=1 Tax=Laspinema olomoucense TaxID=3231600 RepID=UPI0021BB31EE|nr:hypothetical protein [Laspinema sp. D3d]MCT7971254.1 hypothetical protein [Laspinema sp. D3d]
MLKLSEEIKSQLIEFLSKAQQLKVSRLWISDEKMKVYIRKSVRNYNEDMKEFLDIATIEVERQYRFQGLTKQFLQFCRANSPYPVRVENCCNPHLQTHLQTQGWIQVDFDYYAPD